MVLFVKKLPKIIVTMLDKNTESVLFTIVAKCNGKYKILDADDFDSAYSANLDYYVNALCDGGYLLVQYKNNGEYLLIPTAKGSEYFNDKSQSLISRAVLNCQVKRSSFFGAFLGSLIAQILSVIIYFLVLSFG